MKALLQHAFCSGRVPVPPAKRLLSGKTILLALTLAAIFRAVNVSGDVTLPDVFSDRMVLQTGMRTPVFGSAKPNAVVTVTIDGQTVKGQADDKGKWMVRLDPLQPGGPYTLTVEAGNKIVINDVLAGDVWLASGQSNMRYPLSRAKDAAAEIARSEDPQIRYFRSPGRRWVKSTPQTSPTFSAVAYFFALDLRRTRGVPVGIIDNAVNGALAQLFLSPAAFAADPELTAAVARHRHSTGANSSIWDRTFASVAPYGITGAIWFQGEGNRDYPVTYRHLTTALIKDWRAHWSQGDFPFLICQLTNRGEKREDPQERRDCVIREVQLDVARSVPNTGLVVTIDLNEIADVHFPDKKPCGQRLATAARAIAHGEAIVYSGPIYENVAFEGGRAIVSFSHVGGGLKARGDALTGFTLCGPDRRWVRAKAVIEGDKVVVSAEGVPQPVAVRYGWELNPDCNLYNLEGLPASPFRSDGFESYFTRDLH